MEIDRRKKAKDKGISVGDQVIVARRKTTIKTPWDPNTYQVVYMHHRRETIVRGRSTLQRRREESETETTSHQTCQARDEEKEIDYDIKKKMFHDYFFRGFPKPEHIFFCRFSYLKSVF